MRFSCVQFSDFFHSLDLMTMRFTCHVREASAGISYLFIPHTTKQTSRVLVKECIVHTFVC